jgi:hypothetical protein
MRLDEVTGDRDNEKQVNFPDRSLRQMGLIKVRPRRPFGSTMRRLLIDDFLLILNKGLLKKPEASLLDFGQGHGG